MLREGAFRVCAGYLKQALVQQAHAQKAELHTRRNLYVAHVVYAKAPGLLDPVFNERVAQGMFGFGFSQVSALDNETVFASFIHGLDEPVVNFLPG
jgi:hypothetical protein